MESKLQVFVSSTFTDLIDERQAAVGAILKSGHIPAGMELFTAGDTSQWDVIQRWITDADIYMLILGGRYGTIEPETGISYTELEYDFAVGSNKPHFAVVIEDDALEEKVKARGRSVIETENPDKLKTFRTKVLKKMSSFFSDEKDVKIAVLETIPQLARDYELRGWVRATEMPDTKALADELSRVHAENKNLREKLSVASKKLERTTSKHSVDDKEFAEIYQLLDETKVSIKALHELYGDAADLPEELPVVQVFLAMRDRLMNGVENQYGMQGIDKFLFFDLCPKLQTFELVENQKVAGAKYRRYATTKKGDQFLAFVDRTMRKIKGDDAGEMLKEKNELSKERSSKKSPKRPAVKKSAAKIPVKKRLSRKQTKPKK